MRALPLNGLRIVELASYVAGPLAGMTLAQLGADVIRVDPLGGAPDTLRWPLAASGTSLYWAGLNKGKRSITLDLRSEAGRQLLAELVCAGGEAGGIVLTNAGERSGLRYEDLRTLREDLIYVQVTGTSDGRSAVDYTANAASGFPMVTGPEDGIAPVGHVLPAWDVTCGLYAAIGVLTAERHRRATGTGRHVRVSLEDVALATAGNLGYLAEAEVNAATRPRVGNAVYGTYGRTFSTMDGRYVMVVALTTRHWRDLIELTGMAEAVQALEKALGADFSREEERYRHRRVLDALLEPWFADRPLAAVEAGLRSTSVIWSRYRTFTDLVTTDREELLANPMFGRLDQPGVGGHIAPGSPLAFDPQPRVPAPAPTLGEHAREIVVDVLGRGVDEFDRLRAAGVVGCHGDRS